MMAMAMAGDHTNEKPIVVESIC
eukprot:COSAG06_NODE_44975_length_358_cov_1.972973_1_plen_22_part_10